ncbi:MAG TPA: zinc ribbon domain-containing protein [Candidatus Krumholzibacterium sp.]|nr:zinc ribbon domain-containing protein [Candidatus Krumholzibacterium sp.]
MPIFEYRCAKCGKAFEELVQSSDTVPPCPHCGSRRTEKQISTFSCHSSGSGGGGGCPHASGGG